MALPTHAGKCILATDDSLTTTDKGFKFPILIYNSMYFQSKFLARKLEKDATAHNQEYFKASIWTDCPEEYSHWA